MRCAVMLLTRHQVPIRFSLRGCPWQPPPQLHSILLLQDLAAARSHERHDALISSVKFGRRKNPMHALR
jgi:hypothetical protein